MTDWNPVNYEIAHGLRSQCGPQDRQWLRYVLEEEGQTVTDDSEDLRRSIEETEWQLEDFDAELQFQWQPWDEHVRMMGSTEL